jgi:hypothetical protein
MEVTRRRENSQERTRDLVEIDLKFMGIKNGNSKTRDRQERRMVIRGAKVDRGDYGLRRIKRRRRLASSKESLIFK